MNNSSTGNTQRERENSRVAVFPFNNNNNPASNLIPYLPTDFFLFRFLLVSSVNIYCSYSLLFFFVSFRTFNFHYYIPFSAAFIYIFFRTRGDVHAPSREHKIQSGILISHSRDCETWRACSHNKLLCLVVVVVVLVPPPDYRVFFFSLIRILIEKIFQMCSHNQN